MFMWSNNECANDCKMLCMRVLRVCAPFARAPGRVSQRTVSGDSKHGETQHVHVPMTCGGCFSCGTAALASPSNWQMPWKRARSTAAEMLAIVVRSSSFGVSVHQPQHFAMWWRLTLPWCARKSGQLSGAMLELPRALLPRVYQYQRG